MKPDTLVSKYSKEILLFTCSNGPFAFNCVQVIGLSLTVRNIYFLATPLYIYTYIVFQAGACEYGNELSGSTKCGEFLD